jgi:hypothetical protein
MSKLGLGGIQKKMKRRKKAQWGFPTAEELGIPPVHNPKDEGAYEDEN